MVKHKHEPNFIRQRGYGEYSYGSKVKKRPIIYYTQKGHGIGSLFKTFFRFMKPLFKTGLKVAKPFAKKAVKKAGKYALKEGVRTATDIFDDIAKGEKIKNSAKKRSKETVNRVIKNVSETAWKNLINASTNP